MPNLSQRYIAALGELSQFHYVRGNKSTLTHILSGVQVAPESDDEAAEAAEDVNYLLLTFAGGHHIDVDASQLHGTDAVRGCGAPDSSCWQWRR